MIRYVRIHVYTCDCMKEGQSKKRNITLSVNSDIARKAKSSLALSGKTMSKVFEEALESYVSGWWISSMAAQLGIKVGSINPRDIPKIRPKAPKNFDSASIIRKMREGL